MTIKRISFVIALGLISGLALRGCLRKEVPTKAVANAMLQPLPAGTTAQIYVGQDRITTRTATGITTQYVPEEGSAEINVHDNAVTTVKVTNKGVTHEFGGGFGYADKLRITVDMEILYWNRLGLNGGFAISNGVNPIVPFLGVSYQLDQLHLNNTSAVVGFTLKKDLLVGCRVRF